MNFFGKKLLDWSDKMSYTDTLEWYRFSTGPVPYLDIYLKFRYRDNRFEFDIYSPKKHQFKTIIEEINKELKHLTIPTQIEEAKQIIEQYLLSADAMSNLL